MKLFSLNALKILFKGRYKQRAIVYRIIKQYITIPGIYSRSHISLATYTQQETYICRRKLKKSIPSNVHEIIKKHIINCDCWNTEDKNKIKCQSSKNILKSHFCLILFKEPKG